MAAVNATRAGIKNQQDMEFCFSYPVSYGFYTKKTPTTHCEGT